MAAEPTATPPLTPRQRGDVRRRPAGRHRGRCTSGSQTLSFTVDQIGNGAKSLLDEVATGKVTGEEEAWSHTDLYDFQANVDGARVGVRGPAAGARGQGPGARASRSTQRFDALQTLLDQLPRRRGGFVLLRPT